MSLNNYRVIRFYTNEPQPLPTNKQIPFILEYQNNSSSDTSMVPAEIHLGTRVQKINLPGIKAHTSQRITIQLTNNISEELERIGVRISDNDSSEAFKTYDWEGVLDLKVGEVFSDGDSEPIQIDDQVYSQYKVQLNNYGTKRAHNIECDIFVDYKKIGTASIPEIAPRKRVTVQFPIRRNPGTAHCTFKVSESGNVVDNRNVDVVIEKLRNDVEVVSFEPQKSSFSSDEPGVVNLTVKNVGNYGVSNLKSSIHMVDVDTGKILNEIGRFRFSGVLLPGTTAKKTIQINNAQGASQLGLKVTIDCDDQINDTNYLNNSKYVLLKFGSSNETDHSSCNKYDKAKKIRLYKFYADPARIPDVKYEYDENEYFLGEINLTQTAHGFLVSLDEYAGIAGGVVNSNSITRFGHTLKFFDDSRNFKVINNNFKSRFEFDAKSNVPAIEIEGKMYVDPETLSKALGANLVYYKESVLEIFDPHFHTVCDTSIRPTAIGNEKPQYNKVIFVGGPWIDGWNSSEIRGMKLSENFTMGEFQCGGFNNGVATCQCGHTIIVAKDMIDEWQKVREYFNSSFTVTSGYRCVLHNRGIGASKGSRHQNGDAADMTTAAGYNQIRNRILMSHCDLPNPRDGRVSYKGNFNGVAASSSQNFVHADTRSWPSNWNY